jgi:hypothetical protein
MQKRDGLRPDQAERMLTEWAASYGGRDAVVLAAHRAGVSKHRIHVLTGIARTTIDRIVSEEATVTDSTEVKSREQELLRQRTMAALLGSGLTSRGARIFLGADPVVIIQLAIDGPASARRSAAAKVIAACLKDGLGLRQEPNGAVADEAYLMDGHAAEVYELVQSRRSP